MKKMMKLIIIACLTMVFVLAPVKYSVAAENSCPHLHQGGGVEELSSWTYSHAYNSQTCYVRAWYTRTTVFCYDCGETLSVTDAYHETHSINHP